MPEEFGLSTPYILCILFHTYLFGVCVQCTASSLSVCWLVSSVSRPLALHNFSGISGEETMRNVCRSAPDSLDMHMDSNHWNLPHSWLLSFPWAVYNREIMVRMLTVRRPSTRHADTVMQGTEEAHRIHSSSFLFAHMFLQVYPGDAAPASGCSLCASRNLADLNVWNIFKKGHWSLVSDGRRLPGVCSTGEQEEPTTPATSRRWSRRNFIPKGREITGSHWGVACLKRPFFLWDYTLDSYANGYPQRYDWLFPQSGSWKMNERNDVKVLSPTWKHILHQVYNVFVKQQWMQTRKGIRAPWHLIHDTYQSQEGVYSQHSWD